MKHNFLEQFYTIDSETGDYIIEISLKDYDEVFNSWDSSVYNIRDLDSSLKSFLLECSRDIEMRNNIILRFNMVDENKDDNIEETVTNGIRNYFNYCLHFTKNNIYQQTKKIIVYVLVSFIFTFLSFFLQKEMEADIFNKIILQALLLGGWVFLWEAFTLLFFQGRETLKKKKEYKRLLMAPVKFRYNNL